jgi:hypothetical protein
MYSSAQVTSRQLALSVEQGLAATDDTDSFGAVQRRLMTKVQEEMAKHAAGAFNRPSRGACRAFTAPRAVLV